MSTRRRILIAVAVGGLVAAGGWAFLFRRPAGRVDETLALQHRLLAEDLAGRERKQGVASVVRAIDKMDAAAVKRVQDALVADWRAVREQARDAYFAAAEADRSGLLDRDIRRFVTAGELWFATSPRSNGRPPPAKPRKKPAATAGKAGPRPTDPTEKLEEIYRGALLARAKKRAIPLPTWIVDGPPR
ncbi:MAG: hypothetical protein ACKO6B_05165 [Planctomycetia bacterium]